MRIERIDHIVLTVRDVDATLAFYTRILGMEVITFADGRKALRFGRQKINLHPDPSPIEPRAARPTAGACDICLITPTPLAEVGRHLDSAGIAVELGPVARTGAEGPITSLYIRDPDGNLIEIANAKDKM